MDEKKSTVRTDSLLYAKLLGREEKANEFNMSG
jgi:hypothetical protein